MGGLRSFVLPDPFDLLLAFTALLALTSYLAVTLFPECRVSVLYFFPSPL